MCGHTFTCEIKMFFKLSDKLEKFPTRQLSQILSNEASGSSGIAGHPAAVTQTSGGPQS